MPPPRSGGLCVLERMATVPLSVTTEITILRRANNYTRGPHERVGGADRFFGRGVPPDQRRGFDSFPSGRALMTRES
jgi:hypothetical protein